MHRRTFLAAAGATLITPGEPSLRQRAAKKNLLFGAMVEHAPLAADPAYAAAIARDCAIIVPGTEAKWAATEPTPGHFDFAALDEIAAFADRHHQHLRLHNLVWSVWNPPWLVPALRTAEAPTILARHITTVAGHLRGRALAWDVVNEPIDTRWPTDAQGLVTGPWWHALGPTYIDQAFHQAHEADPTAQLFLNDDWLEYPQSAKKRAQTLRLLERWLRNGVPIQGYGLEAHLQPDLPFDAEPYRRFLADIAALGLTIHITELDVHDRTLPPDIPARDTAVAAALKNYLDVALDEPAVSAVLTWILTDRYTYQNHDPSTRRPDKLPSRGGLLDTNLTPKPAWQAIAAALDAAPLRPPSPSLPGAAWRRGNPG